MKIKTNGEIESVKSGISVFLFIKDEKGLDPNRIVIEYNGNILKRDKWAETPLKENDILEIVSFVGGG